MRKKILLLFISVVGIVLAVVAQSPFESVECRYAEVVNVNTNLNIRKLPSKQSDVIGKIDKGERVKILKEEQDGWMQIEYHGTNGYVKSSYLKEVVIQSKESQESLGQTIWGWCEEYKFYILFVMSFFVFVWTKMPEDDFRTTMLKLLSYSILLVTGFLLAGRDASLEKDLDCWFENEHWIKHAFNVAMLSFYMFTLINGFICTGSSLAKLGTKSIEDYNEASVGFFLWLVPLILLSVLLGTITAGASIVVVIGLAFWKFFKNCKLMWPKLQYPILIAILGLASCIAIAYVFYNLISNIILLVIYAALFMGFLKAAPQTLSEAAKSNRPSTTTSTSDSNDTSDPYYDTIIKGAGDFGGDVKARTGMFGIKYGENGKKYKKNQYGEVYETD